MLPDDLPIHGEVLTSHVRSIGALARPIQFAKVIVTAAVLAEVRAKLALYAAFPERRLVSRSRNRVRTASPLPEHFHLRRDVERVQGLQRSEAVVEVAARPPRRGGRMGQ